MGEYFFSLAIKKKMKINNIQHSVHLRLTHYVCKMKLLRVIQKIFCSQLWWLTSESPTLEKPREEEQ